MKSFLGYLTIIALLTGASNAAAHELETDGSIGAIIHIDPSDDPIAQQPSTFFFEFKDKDGKFKQDQCACTVHVFQGQQEILSQPLSRNNIIIFPAKGNYQVKVSGNPLTQGQFQSFELVYDIQVNREASPAIATTTTTNWWYRHIIHFLGAGFLAILVPGLIIRERLIERKVKKKNQLVV